MRTKSLAGKIKYVLARRPEFAESELNIAIAVWQTFYYTHVALRVEQDGSITLNLKTTDIMRIPSWQEISRAYARIRAKAPVQAAIFPALPYKDDI